MTLGIQGPHQADHSSRGSPVLPSPDQPFIVSERQTIHRTKDVTSMLTDPPLTSEAVTKLPLQQKIQVRNPIFIGNPTEGGELRFSPFSFKHAGGDRTSSRAVDRRSGGNRLEQSRLRVSLPSSLRALQRNCAPAQDVHCLAWYCWREHCCDWKILHPGNGWPVAAGRSHYR